jgi:hypothetical protein
METLRDSEDVFRRVLGLSDFLRTYICMSSKIIKLVLFIVHIPADQVLIVKARWIRVRYNTKSQIANRATSAHVRERLLK